MTAASKVRLDAAARHTHALLEAVYDGYLVLDGGWQFSYANAAAGRLLRCEPGDLIGRTIWEAYPGLEGSEFQALYRRTMDAGVGGSLTAWYPDHERWYEVTATPLAEGIGICFRDVTEQKRAETMLQQLIDANPYGVFLVDEGFIVRYANQVTSQAFGRLGRELVGMDLREALQLAWAPEAAAQLIGIYERAMRTREVYSSSGVVGARANKDSDEAYDFTIEPTTLPGGVSGLVVHFYDLTERERLLRHLERTQTALTASEERLRGRVELLQAILDSVPAAVFIASDPEARLIQQNRFASQVLKVPLERNPSLSGPDRERPTWFRILCDGEEVPASKLPVQVAARTGRPVRNRALEVVFDGGERRYLLGNATPLFDGEGKSAGAVGAFIDVTELRATERALRESEELYRSIFALAPAGVVVTDESGHLHAFNDQAHEALGYTREEFSRLRLWEINAEEGRAEFQERINEILAAGSAEFGARHRTRDGAVRLMRVRGRIVSVGGHRRILTVWLDVTDFARAERELKESLTLLQAISDTIPDALFVKDRAGRLIFANPATVAHIGKPAEQLIGHDETQWVNDAEQAAAIMRNDREVMESGETRVVEEWLDTPGGRRLFLGTKTPRRNDHGEVVGLIGLSRDITDRKAADDALRRSEEQLRAANAALAEADRRKDDFLATLSHELRNPLSPIRSAAQILGAAQVSPDQVRWAGSVIRRQTEHMARLLDDLLDVARITQGRLSLKLEDNPLSSVVDAALETARPVLEAKHHTLSVQMPAEMPVVRGDRVRLSQILGNLLINAGKYTDPHGRIELAARVDDGHLFMSVKDNGIGIEADEIDGLFTIFMQARAGSERAEGGLGIGLALVKGRVSMHGGRVEARSEGPGRGSEFVVTLPLRRSDGQSQRSPEDVGVPGNASRRVMIVDDNRDAADTLAMLLALQGYQVRAAYGGEEAIALARIFRPEVALVDIGMPTLDGFAVARMLREESWGADMLLVALTGWGGDAARGSAKAAGFDAHITKPVDIEHLARAIHERTRARGAPPEG